MKTTYQSLPHLSKMIPLQKGTRLKGSTKYLDRTSSPRSGLHGNPTDGPNVVTLMVKMALQNLSRLLTSRNSLIIRRSVPMGRSINGGLPPVSSKTCPLRHNLQNN